MSAASEAELNFFAATATCGGRFHSDSTQIEAGAWIALAFLLSAARLGLDKDQKIALEGTSYRRNDQWTGWKWSSREYVDLWDAARQKAITLARAGVSSPGAVPVAKEFLADVLKQAEALEWSLSSSKKNGERFYLVTPGHHYAPPDIALFSARITLSEFRAFAESFSGHQWLIDSQTWKNAEEEMNRLPLLQRIWQKWFPKS